MLTILVDEAYAFDFLAILEVKYWNSIATKNKSTEDIRNKMHECANHIKKQISEQKFFEITESDEYLNLLEANRKTFEWVDKAKTDSCKASDVDRSNYERCKARNALQEKFFPDRLISEVKFGYNEAYEHKP